MFDKIWRSHIVETRDDAEWIRDEDREPIGRQIER